MRGEARRSSRSLVELEQERGVGLLLLLIAPARALEGVRTARWGGDGGAEAGRRCGGDLMGDLRASRLDSIMLRVGVRLVGDGKT